MRALVVAGALVACTLGCGGSPSAAEPTPPEASTEAPPATTWDPPPWVPPPEDDPRTGRVAGLSASGGFDQPRWLLVRLVRAIRDADRASLEQLLTDPVYSRRLRRRPRAWWLDRLTSNPRPRGLGSEVPVDRLIALRGVEARAVESLGRLPPGIRSSDLLLTVPLRARGRQLLGPLLFWRSEGQVLVRLEPEARVLGL
ncbi:MAG: hypothetical protein ACODAG_06320 [Myxococcota bacterium]